MFVPLLLLWSLATYISSRPLKGNVIYENLATKLRLADTETPKLIILSGSNGEYGYSSKQIEQVYGIPSVNMGEHAGQGLDYILYRGSLAAHAGDLFVLPLEYEQYESTGPSGDHVSLQAVLHDQAYRRQLGLVRWLRLIASIPLKIWTRLVFLEFSHHKLDPKSEPIDPWGDPLQDTDPAVIHRTQESLKREAPRSFYVSEESMQDLSAFHRSITDKGARMVVIFPCIYGLLLDSKSAQFQTSVGKLRSELAQNGIRLLGDPEQFTFGPADVYDTIYHENAAGRKVSTERLMTILKENHLLDGLPSAGAKYSTAATGRASEGDSR